MNKKDFVPFEETSSIKKSNNTPKDQKIEMTDSKNALRFKKAKIKEDDIAQINKKRKRLMIGLIIIISIILLILLFFFLYWGIDKLLQQLKSTIKNKKKNYFNSNETNITSKNDTQEMNEDN